MRYKRLRVTLLLPEIIKCSHIDTCAKNSNIGAASHKSPWSCVCKRGNTVQLINQKEGKTQIMTTMDAETEREKTGNIKLQ